MPTINDKPISKLELEELIFADMTMAKFMIDPIAGRYLVRNEQTRREYEIRATIMKHYLENTKWIKPNE